MTESMDDFDFDNEAESEDGSESPGQGVKQVRDALTREQKRYASLEKKYAKLQEQWEQRQAVDRRQQIESLGLSQGHVALFEKTFDGSEVTAEAVQQWASMYEIPLGGEVPPEPEPAPGFTPVTVGTNTNVHRMSVQEWKELARQDPAQAQQVMDRVDWPKNTRESNFGYRGTSA